MIEKLLKFHADKYYCATKFTTNMPSKKKTRCVIGVSTILSRNFYDNTLSSCTDVRESIRAIHGVYVTLYKIHIEISPSTSLRLERHDHVDEIQKTSL